MIIIDDDDEDGDGDVDDDDDDGDVDENDDNDPVELFQKRGKLVGVDRTMNPRQNHLHFPLESH